jgi:quercetin dioxygenase-like cupin family protein
MTMTIHPQANLAGDYDLRELDTVLLIGAHEIKTGLVRIAKGTRSPVAGLRAGADHEIGYVVSGKVRIETPVGVQVACGGDTLVASPDIPHATTALEDTVIFFALAIRCERGGPGPDHL